MADNFGLKIGIEGEKEFKKALADINQSFKVLGSEMKLVESEFDKQDKRVTTLTAKNEVLNKQIDEQKNKITTLEQALANAAESFGENDRRTQAWAVQLNNAKADLNNLQRELSDNTKALDSTGNELNEAENQAGKFGDGIKISADQADDAGGRFEKLGGVLKGVGVAMGAALAAIGTAAVSAGKALTDMTVNSAAYADEILTQSTVTGMSTESLQAYKYAAELVDTSMETLTGSMAKQVRSMSSARDGSEKFAEAYKKLGVSVTDSHGNLRDSEKVYWETIDALGKISNETERDVLAMQIFGKSAQELNPLIQKGSAGIAELTEEAKRMGAVMSEDSLNALGKFDDSVQRLKAGGEAAKNMLGMVLLPQLQLLADDGVSLLGEFTKGLSDADGDWTKISEVIGNTVGSLVNMLMENLPNLIQVGLDIVTSIGGAIVVNLPVIIDSAVQIIMTLLQALIAALPQITEGALQLVMALVQGIIDNLPQLIEAAIQMAAFAESESVSMSENISWGFRKRYAEGDLRSLPIRNLYGLDRNAKGEIVIREEEAKIVRRIYDEFLAGQNTQFISDMLNANGVPARHKGAIWYNKTVINILQNEKYAGDVLFQKTFSPGPLSKCVKNRGELPQYWLEDAFPAIIDKKLWRVTQYEYRRRAKKTMINQCPEYPFIGRFYCGICGRPVIQYSSRGTGGIMNIWWRCATKISRYKESDDIFHEDARVPLGRPDQVFTQAWNLIMSKRQMYAARLKKVSETDESELTRYHASEMLRLMDEVGKITEFDYMLSVKVLDRMELMPENKLAVVFLSGIRITI